MARENRNGHRRERTQNLQRTPDLGYYLIFTDTENTEENYFWGLKESLPEKLRNRLVLKVFRAKTEKLVDECLKQISLCPQYAESWIVFDRDFVPNFDRIIANAEKHGIHVGWSNPCIEIWFFAYYGSMPGIWESTVCCQRFGEMLQRKTGREYKKSEREIYAILSRTGDEEAAIATAEQRLRSHKEDGPKKPSEMCPCTSIHLLVSEIKNKTQAISEHIRDGA